MSTKKRKTAGKAQACDECPLSRPAGEIRTEASRQTRAEPVRCAGEIVRKRAELTQRLRGAQIA
jgi:hypothetical protein